MKHHFLLITLGIAFIYLGGCSDKSQRQFQSEKSIEAETLPTDYTTAPDIRDGWEWSKADITSLTKRAESGDVQVANRVFQYYSVHEDHKMMSFWDDWLFKHGDPGAIERRSFELETMARKRADGDPRKLEELREAERLWHSVHPSKEGNPFLGKLRAEIASAERVK